MGVNRYTSLTPSKFNPLSLEEIMLVPAMQRKRHDDTVKGLEEIRAKLANVDPEDKYFEEAVKLREQLNNKLTSQVEQINAEGFNPNSTGQFLAMNREYQDMVSPTGKLGMINQEKKNTQAYIENYKKEGLAMGLTPAEMQVWIDKAHENRNKELPLYDEKGRTIGYKIDKGVVKAQDIFKDFAEHAARTGMSSVARGNISAGITTDANDNFTYVNTTGWDSEKGNNKEQIKSALDFMNSRLNDPNSDYSKYYDYIGQDKNSIVKSLQEQSGIYKKDVDNYKSQQQITNLIDNRPKAGSGEDEDKEGERYSNQYQSFKIGDDYKKVAEEANKVLNNPKATAAEKIAARERLDLIDDVKNELATNDKNFKNRSDYTKSVENSKFMQDLIAKAEKEKSPYLNRLKSLQQKIKNGELTDVSSPNIFFTKGVEINGVNYGSEGLGKYAAELDSFFGKHVKQYRNYKKQNIDAINAAISTRGTEGTEYTADMKPEKRQEYFQNLKDALNQDTVKPSNANYIDENGKAVSLELNDSNKSEIMQLLNSTDEKNGNIVSANPARQGGVVGMKIKFKPNADSSLVQNGVLNDKDFTGNQAVEMFIPITQYGDGMTGLKHTTNRVYNNLPTGLKREFDKLVSSTGSGSTTQKSRLGNVAVSANTYFPDKYNDDTKIDFLKTGKGNTRMITPHIIEKGKQPKAMTWNDGIDYNRLNEPSYFAEIGRKGLLDNIVFSYTSHKKTNKPLMLSNGDIDYVGMINTLKYQEIKLPNTQDIIEFSGLK